MAQFPSIGISQEELFLDIGEEYQRFVVLFEGTGVYEDAYDGLERLTERVEKTGIAEAKVSEIENLSTNMAEHYVRVVQLNQNYQRLDCLIELFKKYFPENEKISKLESVLSHIKQSHIDPFLKYHQGSLAETIERSFRLNEPPKGEN